MKKWVLLNIGLRFYQETCSAVKLLGTWTGGEGVDGAGGRILRFKALSSKSPNRAVPGEETSEGRSVFPSKGSLANGLCFKKSLPWAST